jgi:hypothetical protein
LRAVVAVGWLQVMGRLVGLLQIKGIFISAKDTAVTVAEL